MKPEEIKNPTDAVFAVRELIQQIADLREENAEMSRRLELVEKDQGYLAKREPPRNPKFPKILRQYGILPPEERAA